MLKSLFFVMALLFAAPVHAGEAPCSQCGVTDGRPSGQLSSTVETISIATEQKFSQVVTVRFYCEDVPLEQSEPALFSHTKNAKKSDVFKIGVEYYVRPTIACGGYAKFVNAEGICNTLDAVWLAQALAAGGSRKENPICLLGDDAECLAAGYPPGF